MIIWISSFPKSGNTWVRSIISSLIYSNDGIFNFELIKNIDQFPSKKHMIDFTQDIKNIHSVKKFCFYFSLNFFIQIFFKVIS